MKSLIWKDYRLSRSLLLLCAAVWVLLYLVGIGTQLATTWPQLPSLDDWAGMLHSYGTVWLYITMCFAGLFGGHAIACERGDRSANFLACLPPTKWQILTSKFVVAIGTLTSASLSTGPVEAVRPAMNPRPQNADVPSERGPGLSSKTSRLLLLASHESISVPPQQTLFGEL